VGFSRKSWHCVCYIWVVGELVCADWRRSTTAYLEIIKHKTLKGKELAMAKLKIRPLGDKVLVKRVEAESKTAGGIVLPDTAKEKPKRGIVQAVGDGKLLDTGERSKLQVAKGNEVIFSSYAGTDIKVNGDELLIIDETDILAIVES